MCIVCHATGDLHPDCPICGAHVCWADSCIDVHSVACLVAAFKLAYDVDLPTACEKCGRPAPFAKVVEIGDQARQLIKNVPGGAQLVGQICVMFCPAPGCKAEAAEWTRRNLERFKQRPQ